MFLADKYYNDSNEIIFHQEILEKLLNSFDTHNEIYKNIDTIEKKPMGEFKEIINNIEYGNWQYSNFQHLIIYGSNGCGKNFIVKKLLEKIYGKKAVEVNDVEYTINGYSNTKTKVEIKQSKYHILLEPKNNGFDKYLIQEIIQDYAKTEILNILKYKKLFKVVVIDKIDNLSYYAQASLRRTMEKYANTCKFIFICDQLSKIIEPLKSRCLLVRIPLPTNQMLINIMLNICQKENIELQLEDYKEIIKNSNNNINILLWLLEFKKHNCLYDENWSYLVDKITDLIIDKKNYTTISINKLIVKFREYFYILFITNIDFQLVIRNIMLKLINKFDDIKIKYHIIEITSVFEKRINKGTRYIIHLEAYILRLIKLFLNASDYNIINKNLLEFEALEI
jgi:replication factor C subunit 3/5